MSIDGRSQSTPAGTDAGEPASASRTVDPTPHRAIGRRSFLRAATAGAAWLVAGPEIALAAGRQEAGTGTAYQVGAGSSSDGYTATQHAVAASGQWPGSAMAGRTVVIKPNLVAPKPSTSGATTDPQVVRALVDLALAAGAASVLIVEGGAGFMPANFTACGYSFFSSYNPLVQLVDFGTQPVTQVTVPNGLAYQSLYLPTLVADPTIVFISAAKLKCHVDAVVTLSMKNLFGLATPLKYAVPGRLPRMDLHTRGVDEAVIDLNLARPVDFAVIDGIWAMEGNGPLSGTPIQMNVVLAGLNPVAVDRTALTVMEIPQYAVPHLAYASHLNLGPADMRTVTVLGDAFTPQPFVRAQTPPIVFYPAAYPSSFTPESGQYTTLAYRLLTASSTRLEVISDNDSTPGITVLRTLHDWASRAAGVEMLPWDGRNDMGILLPPGRYLARVQARYTPTSVINYATGPVTVQ